MDRLNYIKVTIRIDPGEEDESGFVALCEELGIASEGETIDEALENIEDALTVFIEGLHREGALEGVLKDHGVNVYDSPPESATTVEVNPGEVVSTLVASLGRSVAFI